MDGRGGRTVCVTVINVTTVPTGYQAGMDLACGPARGVCIHWAWEK